MNCRDWGFVSLQDIQEMNSYLRNAATQAFSQTASLMAYAASCPDLSPVVVSNSAFFPCSPVR